MSGTAANATAVGEDLFFGNAAAGGIGRVSADGLTWSTNWVTLPGETNTVEGDLYVDQTGLWGNDLLAVTASWYEAVWPWQYGTRNVWRIDSNGTPTWVTTITHAVHLEGLLTLSNNPAQYGPWAGKLLTADENTKTIYSVDTSGAVQSWNLPSLPGGSDFIAPDTFRLIPPSNHLYIVDWSADEVLKLPKELFTAYVGDILAVQSGEQGESSTAALYIIHWNGSGFDITTIPFWSYVNFTGDALEKAAFAPVDIPPVQ